MGWRRRCKPKHEPKPEVEPECEPIDNCENEEEEE